MRIDDILAVPGRRYAEFTELIAEHHPRLVAAVSDPETDVICETWWQGRRLVIAHNATRAVEQSQARREAVETLDALGQHLAERLNDQDAGKPVRGRRATDRGAYKRFHQAVLEKRLSHIVKADLGSPQFSYWVDEAAWKAAERLDGKLLLVTSLKDFGAEAVVQRYRSLADIERGFRVLKSEIAIAPVYHRLPPRIRAHALICFLALVLYRILRTRLTAAGSEHSPERALRILRQIQQHRVKAGIREYSGLSRLTPEHRQFFKEVGIALPQ